MGRLKKTKKFALVKRIIAKNDERLKKKVIAPVVPLVRQLTQVSSSLFFKHNESLKPPYRIIVDTNFINFSIQNKLEMVKAMMDCLFAKCIPCISDCVMAELEKMGEKYRIALRYIFNNIGIFRLRIAWREMIASNDCHAATRGRELLI